jgi:hypothetical protein
MSIRFLLDEKPDVVRGGSGGQRKVFLELRTRSQSEQLHRLALAGGFRVLRSFGIDRLDPPAHTAGRGSIAPDG